MLVIPCPHCGERFENEFAYGGDATLRRPEIARTVGDEGEAEREAMFRHVYLRDNPRGEHLEWWHHVAGCRAWIRVKRDTAANRVLGAWPATGEIGA